ncbi:hypothetical protein PGQ11_008957 [Apiospora arundinis]|uniref:Uncharacterized protein n=1 Tax=Apiospora arundinis TaxID=335852 RepID=A0ABR2IHB0_9PEZI
MALLRSISTSIGASQKLSGIMRSRAGSHFLQLVLVQCHHKRGHVGDVLGVLDVPFAISQTSDDLSDRRAWCAAGKVWDDLCGDFGATASSELEEFREMICGLSPLHQFVVNPFLASLISPRAAVVQGFDETINSLDLARIGTANEPDAVGLHEVGEVVHGQDLKAQGAELRVLDRGSGHHDIHQSLEGFIW